MFGYFYLPTYEIGNSEKIFKLIYCSICKNLKQHYGTRSIFLNIFDTTFLALYLVSSEYKTSTTKCFNPISLKRVQIIEDQEDLFEKLIDLNLLAVNISVMDAAIDNQNLRHRVFKNVFKRTLEQNLNRISQKITGFDQKISKIFSALCKEQSIIQIHCIADLIAEIVNELFNDAYPARIVRNMIVIQYILDAFEDYHSDIKRSMKNPLLLYEKSQVPDIVEQIIYQNINELYKLADNTAYKQVVQRILFGSIIGKFNQIKGEKWNERDVLRYTRCENRRLFRRDQRSLQGLSKKISS